MSDTTPTILWLAGLLALVCVAQAIWSARLRQKLYAAAAKARRFEVQMAELSQLYLMAEEIAAIGLWQYFPAEGRQHWSMGLREMFGVAPEEEFLPGGGETLLATNGIDLVSEVMAKQRASDRFSIHLSILRLDGSKRALAMRVNHIRGHDGKPLQVVGVVMDVTEQTQRERVLEASRDLALREALEARKLAQTDPLTGLANRRHLMAELDRMVIRARRENVPLVVIVLDIDHFKQINDGHGHVSGDKVLCRVGEVLSAQARRGDVVGRIGGEEFVWVAPGADNTIARILAERLRQAISETCPKQALPRATVSVGFADLKQDDSGVAVFARADQALYVAKGQGRNMVRMAA